MLHGKQASESEPSPKLIIVAIGTHGSNHGGAEIAMLHLIADPQPLDGLTGCMSLGENGDIICMLPQDHKR